MVTVGTFLMLMIIWNIFTKKYSNKIYLSFFVLTIVVELMMGRGYFIQIGSQQIAYRTLCEIILLFLSIVKVKKFNGNVKRRVLTNYLQLSFILVMGWLLLIRFPSGATGGTMEVSWDEILMTGVGRQDIIFNTSMIVEILQIVIYMIIAVVAFSYVSQDEWDYILDKVVKWSSVILQVSMIEVVTKYLFKSNVFLDFIDTIIGTSIATETSLRIRGSGYTLCGFTKEGSAQAIAITFLFIIYFCRFIEKNKTMCEQERKKYYLAFGCMGITFILSMSFSILYYVACLGLMLWCIFFEKRGNSRRYPDCKFNVES